jgi:phosphatidylethanolamine/phosphatidyl-N-methylethanolamine N-methyltransferase
MSDTARFMWRLVTKPKTIGAIAPSSRRLARAMAAEVDANGPILELGPGTGVATEALIARGVAPSRITAVEYDAHFAALIHARFPGVNVIRGDAFDLGRTLGNPAEKFAGAISGVPLLNHAPDRRTLFLSGVLDRLTPGAPYVQFSYGLVPPVDPPAGVSVRRTAFVLMNMPPARVWVYRRA